MKNWKMKSTIVMTLVCVAVMVSVPRTHAEPDWNITYQSLNQRWQPMLQQILTICGRVRVDYQHLSDCAASLNTYITQEPLRLFSATADNAVALGIEYRIGRAAPLRIYQIYEFQDKDAAVDPHYRQRKPFKSYMTVKFSDYAATSWTSLSYEYQGRFFLASQKYLEQGQGNSPEADAEIKQLLNARDLDYKLKWGSGPALGWDLNQLDWMASLLNKVKPAAFEPVL